jgi:hypothetical protein
LAQHTREVLGALCGLTEADIDGLAAGGVMNTGNRRAARGFRASALNAIRSLEERARVVHKFSA